MKKMTYKEKFIQMNKEAKATWIVAAILIAFWWITGFGMKDMDFTILAMPGWAIVSCIGSWLLSIVLVWVLLKKVFVDFDLDDEEENEAAAKRAKEGK